MCVPVFTCCSRSEASCHQQMAKKLYNALAQSTQINKSRVNNAWGAVLVGAVWAHTTFGPILDPKKGDHFWPAQGLTTFGRHHFWPTPLLAHTTFGPTQNNKSRKPTHDTTKIWVTPTRRN